ncbi:Abi family protein [Paenibacillus wenxiniae]|uniref:Abi family protein n=1 Tax=Paenibacillus wenxiniae TaxID=1636843 RepID=A0ABW4REZ3_9BACL
MNERILKRPTTVREQLDILIDKKLIVENEIAALNLLRKVNYYRFTAYTLPFKQNNIFSSGITFNKVYELYQFDAKFRNALMEIIEYIEISFRTQISNDIALKYGSTGYRNSNNFYKQAWHLKFIQEIDRCIEHSYREPVITHYRENYNAQYPIWVVSEVMTFGIVSKLYKNMKLEDRKRIARTYYANVDYRDIENWLEVLTIIRNRCAHYSRLFNYKIPTSIKYTRNEKATLAKNLVYGIIYNSKYLITDQDFWTNWVIRLVDLISRYKEIDLTWMGFPPDWKQLLISK